MPSTRYSYNNIESSIFRHARFFDRINRILLYDTSITKQHYAADAAIAADTSATAVTKINGHLVSPEVRYSLQALNGATYRRVLVHLLQPVNLRQVNRTSKKHALTP